MDLWYGTSGPRKARIAIVGEAWGREEANSSLPFVGSSGQELDRMLAEAGIDRRECFATNVIAARPENNQMWRFFIPRGGKNDPTLWGLHPTPEAKAHILRMREQLDTVQPQVVLAAGNYAFWALSSAARVTYKSSDEKGKMPDGGRMVPSGIADFRGSMLWCREDKLRVLPIIHPAAIMRDWSLRSITIHDLKTRVPKALAGDWDGPKLNILIRPDVGQVQQYFHALIHRMNRGEIVEASIDLETMVFDNNFRGITCMSFSVEVPNAITLPFLDKHPSTGDFIPYWPTPRAEAQAVHAMLRFLQHPNARAIGQNFLYDQSYIRDHYGAVPRLSHDTMLANHLIWPGTPKALGYLSSLYCDHHRFWKDDNREWGLKASPDTHFLYNGEDAIRTLEIAQKQRKLLAALGLEALWIDELEKQELAFEMMSRGIRIDTRKRSQLTTDMIVAAEEHQAALLRMIPQQVVDDLRGRLKPTGKFWFNSPQQVSFVLYELLGLPPQRDRKTGHATTGASAIEVLKEKVPRFALLFQLLENIRTIGVLTRTVLRAPLERDNRLSCSFNTGGAETFRWSSSENPFGRGTNLQNITSGDE